MTVDAATKKTHVFQAEVNQLLKLLSDSLYSNRDVFLRELISNAFDATEKRRLEALKTGGDAGADPRITITVDAQAGTLTVSDCGIGMNEQELMDNLGTIARSGTKAFVEQLSSAKENGGQLIGQFGVGFYSAFVVADHVEVVTKRFGSEQALSWVSDGTGEYSIEGAEREDCGTSVMVHLKDDAKDYLETYKIKEIVTKYSDHIAVPVVLLTDGEDGEDGESEEVLNQAKALWTRAKAEISKEQYCEFYKHLTRDYDDPLLWAHHRVEGKTQYTSLVYLPKHPTLELWQREAKRGLKLYVKRVFIMDDAEQLLPNYLRFVKGLVDTDDLPLNVSREILQSNRTVDTIRSGLIKRILGLLEHTAQKDPATYQAFWDAFGQVLKEGPGEDFANKDQIIPLLRFATTHDDAQAQTHSLADVVARMGDDQDKIYYCVADSHEAAKNSPHLEYFRSQGVEVLLLSDRVDEWLLAHLTEFDGKTFQSVTRGDLTEKAEDSQDMEQAKETFEGVLERVQAELESQVKEVRLSKRLTDSPSCLVADENDISTNLRRMLAEAGQDLPDTKLILELNPDHVLCQRLRDEHGEERFSDWCHVLYDQAMLAEGGHLKDPAGFVKRMNKLMM